jgi:ankyrin repeat protein
VVLQFLKAGAKLPTTNNGQVTTELLYTLEQSLTLVKHHDIKRLTPYHILSVEDTSRLMDGGMRELLEMIFTQLPRQKARGKVFGSLLVIAATTGDQASVELLLRHGALADSSFSNCLEVTALGGAAQFGHLDVMRTLLNAGAYINSSSMLKYPLANAVVGGHADAVQALVERGATFQQLDRSGSSWRPLFQRMAVQYNNLETLQYLVTVGGQADLSALAAACAYGKTDFAACLLAAVREATPNPLESEGGPLYLACLNGHADIAHQVIEHGANVNQGVHFGTPLIAAASRGHADIVRLLLDNGADPNQQSRGNDFSSKSSVDISQLISPLPPSNPVRRRRQKGERTPFTALSMACREGFLAVAKLLLFRGAVIAGPPDPTTGTGLVPNAIANTCEGDWSPAKHAILELLLEPSSIQSSGHSARCGGLFQASRAHNHAAFDLIMEYFLPNSATLVLAGACGSLPFITHHLNQGINPQTQASDGHLPLHAAAYNMHTIAVSHLLTHGGADANQLDRNNSTPLLSALLGFDALLHDKHSSHEYQADMGIVQFEAIVQCLLDHSARTDLGSTPFGQALDLAGLIGHKEIERLLQERETRDSGLDRFE